MMVMPMLIPMVITINVLIHQFSAYILLQYIFTAAGRPSYHLQSFFLQCNYSRLPDPSNDHHRYTFPDE
jgi:hypothetical protein